jgi:hypothetical protein
VIRLQQIRPATNGATHEASVSSPSRSLILRVVAHSLKAGLGVLFLYLGTTKLLGRDEAARLAAMGVDRHLRDAVGWLELTGAALLLARDSGYLLHSLVAGVALIEVGLLHRAPLAAVACLAAHGLSTWARSAHDRNRTASKRLRLRDSNPPPGVV